MTSKLKSIDYGKSRVRVARIERYGDRHDFCDLTVALRLEGPFEDCYLKGDNSMVVPTDTMKNTVYALAESNRLSPIEGYAQVLGEHFLSTHKHLTGVSIDIVEQRWRRIDPHTFEQDRSTRLASVEMNRKDPIVQAGIDNLVLLKTTHSSFEGFLKDKYTTLRETSDRILATSVKAVWRYDTLDIDFNAVMESCRSTLIAAFAGHESRAVQQTIYAMGDAVLQAHREIREIRLTLPNRHYLPVDLEPFGLENRNEVFLPADEPYGLIEACLSR